MISKSVFECVMNSKRAAVIGWLCSKYSGLREEDSEDIVQESCFELWKNVHEAVGMKVLDVVRLWKVICRNRYTHWLRHQRFTKDWDDSRLQYGWEERDFCWDRGNWEKMMKREAMYDYIDCMKERDRMLMQMALAKKSMEEITIALGNSGIQVTKNRKSKLVGFMKRDLPANFKCVSAKSAIAA